MTTLSLISNGCSLQHHYYNLVRQIKDLFGNFPSYSLYHVHCEPNQVIDSIIKFSLSLPLALGCLMSRGKIDIARLAYQLKAISYPLFLPNRAIGNASNNINDCQTICWSNCSCIGFKNSNVNGTGFTFILSMESLNIASGGEDNFYILVKSAAHNKGMYLATTITHHLEVFYGSIINIRFIQVSSLLRISVESNSTL
ncbi:PAN-like domain protein [Medicago truncatula]|uniref:PAN-like domain protein n=1 Tax=Medicago truncatula TaxID=3880 RepID=A0A072TQ06_MEDTR|nr:PAN-like domain protein [Medicago truncatula]